MFELPDHSVVGTSQNVIGFQKSNADEFLDQGVPFGLPACFIGVREGFLQHRVGPSFSEWKGLVPFLEVTRHLCAERFELLLSAGLAGSGSARDTVDVGRVAQTHVFDQALLTGRVEGFHGIH